MMNATTSASSTITPCQPLAVGTKAPGFSLSACNAEGPVSLGQYRGQNVILVFYPKDQTPGCTRQLCALQEDFDLFEELDAAILAANPASVESHQRFADKYGYSFPILCDAEKAMARAYQALKPEGGIQRTVYIIDKDGMIRYGKQGMPSDAELADVLRTL